MHRLLYLLLATFFWGSCSLIGLNPKHKTPKKEPIYPEFTRKDSLRGQLNANRSCYDVHFYELFVDVDPVREYLSGKVMMQFEVTKPTQTIQVDLYEKMTLHSITWNGKVLATNREFDAIIVTFDRLLQAGESVLLEMTYEGSPHEAPKPPWDGGFVWKKDAEGRPWVGVACELVGASLWWPLKDHLSDEPDSMRMHFTVPKGLFCVSNGTLYNRAVVDKKETFSWRVTYPINHYNVSLYIGHFDHITQEFASVDGKLHQLHFYPLDYNTSKARRHFRQTGKVLKVYERLFGEYPFWRDNFKLIESPYAGMEHQTAIAYGNSYQNLPGYDLDYIIVHEAAHEWWGNSVSVADFSDIWIHEGFASYCEALFIEKTQGFDRYLGYMLFQAITIRNKRPVIGPKGVKFWDYRDTDVYMKGSLTLHTLRMQLKDDELFFDLIRTFYQNHKYGLATTEDFIALVNEKSGKDFQWLFDQYFYQREAPRLEWAYYFDQNEKQHVLGFRWADVAGKFPLSVKVQTAEGHTYITPTSQFQSVVLMSEPEAMNSDNCYLRKSRSADVYKKLEKLFK